MRPIVIAGFAALLGLAAPAAHASYGGIQPADGYNDFVLGDFTEAGTDAGGGGPSNGLGVAVGGNFAPAGNGTFTVNGPVVVHGSYTNNGGTIGGNLYGYGDVTFANETVNGTVYSGHNLTISGGGEPSGGEQYVNSASVPAYFSNLKKVASVPNPVDFGAAGSYLKSEASYLDTLSSVAGVSSTTSGGNHILTLSGGGANFYDFKVTAAQFSAANTFNINVTGVGGQTPTVVVDVINGAGPILFPSLTPTYSGVSAQYVLFNFAGNGSIDTNHAGIQGAVLAPNSGVYFDGGNIDGTMIAGSLSGNGESHAYAFLGNPNLPSAVVPEPSSVLLMGIGGTALVGLAWRRRLSRPAA